MIVEFVGMPGSGKSEICRRVKALLCADGYAVRTPVERATRMALLSRVAAKTAAICAFALRHPIIFTTLFYNLRIVRNSSTKRKGFPAFNFLFVAAATSAGKTMDSVVLIDQGLMQATAALVYSVGAGPALIKLWTSTAAAGLESDMTVFIDSSDEEIVKRLSSRQVRESRVEADLEFGIKRFRDAIAASERLTAVAGNGSASIRLSIKNETEANLDEATGSIVRRIEDEVNRCRSK